MLNKMADELRSVILFVHDLNRDIKRNRVCPIELPPGPRLVLSAPFLGMPDDPADPFHLKQESWYYSLTDPEIGLWSTFEGMALSLLFDVMEAMGRPAPQPDTQLEEFIKAPGTTSEPEKPAGDSGKKIAAENAPESGSEGTPKSATEARNERITVTGNQVTINGVVYSVTDGGAAFCKALADADVGVWVAGSKMGQMVQPRPDRVFKKLPEEIRALIESKDAKGYRLKPE
jgi:hypothetical protein